MPTLPSVRGSCFESEASAGRKREDAQGKALDNRAYARGAGSPQFSIPEAASADQDGPEGPRVSSYAAFGARVSISHTTDFSTQAAREILRTTGCKEDDRWKWDMFLSHMQRNAQDAVISVVQFLKGAHPRLRCFIDLEIDMKGELEKTLCDGVLNSKCFVFFITDEVLTSKWCLQEIRWALQFQKDIILVRETDERHGGIAMNAFLSQVPDDLKETFQNNIAIPWYREPQYRAVSIKSILQAAALQDTLADDIELFQKMTAALSQVFTSDPEALTVVDVMAGSSVNMRIVLFMGGFLRFKKSPMLDRLYAFWFGFSFWSCGLACTMNLVYQGLPYHVLSTDLLTAYVHLVGWQGWLRWRMVVNSQDMEELLTSVKLLPENRAIIQKASRYGGALVMFLQVAMVTDVLFGFSLPYEVLTASGSIQNYMGHAHAYSEAFVQVHARSMWFVIPPVIAAIFCSYSLFAFVALLHLLDIESLKDQVLKCAALVTRFQLKTKNKNKTDDTSSQAHSNRDSNFEEEIQDLQVHKNKNQLEAKLFTTVSEQMYMAITRTQGHIDRTCHQLGWLWVHLVFFSTMQVLAILNAIRSHIWGVLKDTQYNWWWGLQDFFHLGGGLVLLMAALGILCTVTTALQRLPAFACDALRNAGCPTDRLGSIWALLASQPLGMHIFFRTLYIDVPKAAGFFFVLTAYILQTLIMIAEGVDMRSPSMP